MNWKDASHKEIRKFGFIFTAVFCGIAAVNWALHQFLISRPALIPWYIFGTIGIAVLIINLLNLRPVLRGIYIGWMTFAHVMGWIMTRLILGLFYYVVMTPVGFLMRTFGHDALQLKKKPADSYWDVRKPTPVEPEQYRKQY